MRISLFLECSQCQRRNYLTTKNRKTNEGKLERKKYCRHCRKHTPHKETKV
jgi:large subunit ribosomal protein L33